METDRAGKNALLSEDFYYFGRGAVQLPKSLLPIVKQGQGHRSNANAPYLEEFVLWIRTQKAGLDGTPQMWGDAGIESCGACRAKDDEEDLRNGCDDA